MGRRPSGSSLTDFACLQSPFGPIDPLGVEELRETAYELFFASCRSSPGFGGRAPITYYSDDGGGAGAGGKGGANMAVVSRVKRGLGLGARKAAPPTRMMRELGPSGSPKKGKTAAAMRPMTSAEIMRQQMGVSEVGDTRLRRALMRALVGQTGRRAETIVLPLELLRQLKPSEFTDTNEYHHWQRRQLKVLETGLSLHPSTPLDHPNSAAFRLREVVQMSELKPIDTSKNSEAMCTLCGSVLTLAWRSPNNFPTSDVCHWADGYPLNVYLYLSLIHSIFDLRDETVVLDELDELIELMKKTWVVLGINKMIHDVCFTWALFEQYVITGQIEPDLMCAVLAMLTEVASDIKKADREPGYLKILSATLSSMQGWAEKKLMNYHEGFEKGLIGTMENVLSLALSIAKISEDVPSMRGGLLMDRDGGITMNLLESRVDMYIRSSLKSAFAKIFENGHWQIDSTVMEIEEYPNEVLLQLTKEIKALAIYEKENFSPLLKQWHPVPSAVAVATIHSCFGIVLKQYMARITTLTNESIRVLQTAGKLEKILIQMVVEDSSECDDGGKGVVREMIPYEVDSVVKNLMKNWINERLRIGRECFLRAKETESWNPKSKSEPYAQSAVDLMMVVKVTVDEFIDIPSSVREELVQDLVDGLENLFQDYTSFVSSCGSKQSYIPTLPPLTRCNQDPTFIKLWHKAALCACAPATATYLRSGNPVGPHHSPRPSTSRGTQRLYVRLNTLHYLLSLLHSIDKSLSSTPTHRHHVLVPSHFDISHSSIQSAILHVSRVAAYRLIFIDSARYFYEGLYAYGVAEARIGPGLRTLKQNLSLLVTVLTDCAQPLAVQEVMKAAFDAFLMVLLAGGSTRAYRRADYHMIIDDLDSLKRVFCASGEGLVAEEVVEREAEVVEGVVTLMGMATDRLVEDFTTAACEASGMGAIGFGGVQRVLMPPTTGRWNRSDPNTVLRVLCHRNDEVASWFLKKTFQLPKRR